MKLIERSKVLYRKSQSKTLGIGLRATGGTCSETLERIGTRYGGWVIPKRLLHSDSVAICVGAGEDISFDVLLNTRYGMDVCVMDPTPRAITHVERVLEAAQAGLEAQPNTQKLYDLDGFNIDKFHLVKKALWKERGTVEFFPPANPDHVSYSIVNLQSTTDPIRVDAISLTDLVEEMGLEKIDILKIDIEGAEYEVIRNVLAGEIRPVCLCVEYDELQNPLDNGFLKRVIESITLLRSHGYKLAHKNHSNFTFVLPK